MHGQYQLPPQSQFIPTKVVTTTVTTETTGFIQQNNPYTPDTYTPTGNTNQVDNRADFYQPNVDDQQPTPCCLCSFDNCYSPSDCCTDTKKLTENLCYGLCCCCCCPDFKKEDLYCLLAVCLVPAWICGCK